MKSILLAISRNFSFPFPILSLALSLCLVAGMNSTVMAQVDYECAIDESSSPSAPPPSTNPPCFDVEDVIANCTPVYLRVNFHFFVDDDCTGSFDINNIEANLSQEAAYAESSQPFGHGIAERMIYEMNQRFINNQPQKLENGTYAPDAPCIPLRFVLGDVQIHCDFSFRTQKSWNEFHQKYGQFAPPGINVYYSKHASGASGQGQFYGPGILIGAPDAGLILHEIGHNLSLVHTFPGDDCDDTPQDGVDWDKNCDGDLNDSKEYSWPCWEVLPSSNEWCNGIMCNPNYVVTSPCCNPDNVYNNFMSYNSLKNAITSCQIKNMMTALSTHYPCDYVAQIGGECPPPVAILKATPLDLTEGDCSFCLQGGASMNDDTYNLDVYSISKTSGNLNLFYSTGWTQGPVGAFCFSAIQGLPSGQAPIQPGTNYKAVLTVKNSCGVEHFTDYLFQTPDLGCTTDPESPVGFRAMNPNPASNVVETTFELPGRSPVWLTVNSVYQPAGPTLLYHSNDQNEGESTVSFNVSNWTPGVYSIRLISNYGVVSQTLVKM